MKTLCKLHQGLWLILPALWLSGCGSVADPTSWWEEDSKLQPSELVDLNSTLSVSQSWSRDVGDGSDKGRYKLVPRVERGRIFVADAEGLLQALDASTGSTVWSIETELPISGGPGSGDGLVVVGTSDGEVFAYSQESGELRWKQQVTSEVLSTPAIANGVVIVQSIDGKLVGLKASDGEQQWLYAREVPVLTLRGTSSPVISGPNVIAGFAGGKLVALRLDNGELLWESSVTAPSGRSELERMVDIDGDIVVANGAVFVGSYQGEIAAVSEYSGKVLWRRKLSSYSGVEADWRFIYVSDESGHVWALNPDNGSAMWKQDKLLYRRLSAPAAINGFVVVGDYQGYLHWFDHADGAMVARTRAGSGAILASPEAVNGVVYTYNSDGTLTASSPVQP